MTDLNALMKQVQEMQEKMKQAQKEQARREVTGEAGAGLVKVTLNGRYEARKVEIDTSLLSEDKEIIEDLLAAAINAANKKVAETSAADLSGLTTGLDLPDGFKFT